MMEADALLALRHMWRHRPHFAPGCNQQAAAERVIDAPLNRLPRNGVGILGKHDAVPDHPSEYSNNTSFRLEQLLQ